MSRFLPAPVKGVLAVLCIVLNTLWLFPILMVFAVIKLLIPTPSVRKGCTIVLNRIAWFWIGFNNVLADVLHNIANTGTSSPATIRAGPTFPPSSTY